MKSCQKVFQTWLRMYTMWFRFYLSLHLSPLFLSQFYYHYVKKINRFHSHIFLAALYRYIQKYYLQSSREIKRLDSITRSPIFAQMSETLSGVKTIRAFGLENDFVIVNNRKIDVNTSVQYCNIAANRWLSVRLESVSGSVVSCAALFAVLQKGSIDPGFAGMWNFAENS